MSSKFVTLADDVQQPRTSLATTNDGAYLSRCGPAGDPAAVNALVVNDPNHLATLSDTDTGSADRTSALMTTTARSPMAIGAGLAAGGFVGWKLYPRAVKRYRKGYKAYAITGAGAVVAGVIAHGLMSFALYKWGGR